MWNRVAAQLSLLFGLRRAHCRGPGNPSPAALPSYRRRNIAGVCIALSQAYGWDVALVRIFTVIGFFFSGGIVAVAYLACWIGIPEEPFTLPNAYPPGTTYPPNPSA